MTVTLSEHRQFLNRYYGPSRYIYDLTRKYYLLGRDPTLRALLREDWSALLEVGPGTGRNLVKLHKERPNANYFGLEASDAMLDFATKNCPFARLFHGFAERDDIPALLGQRPDRILFSYCLSMVTEPERALANARRALAPGGQVVVVDFGQSEAWPTWARSGLGKWLEAFHVRPLSTTTCQAWGASCQSTLGGYVLHARLSAAAG